MIQVADLHAIVDAFDPAGNPRATWSRARLLSLLREHPRPLERTSYDPGHVTASGLVLSPDGSSVLLVLHRRLGRWLQPGGHLEPGDPDIAAAARREVREETGLTPPSPEEPDSYFPLGDIQQLSGKIVTAWAFQGDFDPARLVSVTSKVQWPPHSGRQQQFPEVDRAAWFSLAAAREKITKGQASFLEELQALLEN